MFVFAPNSSLRAQVTPSGRGKIPATDASSTRVSPNDRNPDECRAITWSQRLKRVFNIDVTICVHCGGTARIAASIEDPSVIGATLGHFEKHGALEEAYYPLATHATPAAAASRPTGHEASPRIKSGVGSAHSLRAEDETSPSAQFGNASAGLCSAQHRKSAESTALLGEDHPPRGLQFTETRLLES